jgi:hypothetical protein
LEQLACGANLTAFFQLCIVAQDDYADLGLFQIQRKADDAVAMGYGRCP